MNTHYKKTRRNLIIVLIIFLISLIYLTWWLNAHGGVFNMRSIGL